MPRMSILNAVEREVYKRPPVFDADQRIQAHDAPAGLLELAKTMRKPAHQIGLLVSSAYFSATKRFFAPHDYHDRDVLQLRNPLTKRGHLIEQLLDKTTKRVVRKILGTRK